MRTKSFISKFSELRNFKERSIAAEHKHSDFKEHIEGIRCRLQAVLAQAARSMRPLLKAGAAFFAALVLLFSSSSGPASAKSDAYAVFNNPFIDETHIILDSVRPTMKEAFKIDGALEHEKNVAPGFADGPIKIKINRAEKEDTVEETYSFEIPQKNGFRVSGDDQVINYKMMFDPETTRVPPIEEMTRHMHLSLQPISLYNISIQETRRQSRTSHRLLRWWWLESHGKFGQGSTS